ncbi:MAG: MerR family transcriptional regulator [Hyphomicrobiaceae bacterium]
MKAPRHAKKSGHGGEDGAAAPPSLPNASKDTGATEVRYAIGELARELEVTTRTIRFYESKGLIAPQRKGVARIYSRRDRARLILILRGTNLGFSLDDIKAFLELYDADPTHAAQLRMLRAKLDEHIAILKKKRSDIDRTLKEMIEIRAMAVADLAERDGSTD